jgi:hypothetical protein
MMERRERVWVLAWGASAGVSLLLLHRWTENLAHLDAKLHVIWTMYVLAIGLPLTMQMLSRHRAEPLMWMLSVGFNSVMALTSGYVGYQAQIADTSGPGYQVVERLVQIVGMTMICWFVLLPFAQHRLAKERWYDDYGLLFSNAWGNAVKLATAWTFVILFWALLWLWACLFKVVGVNFFTILFSKKEFIYPVTAVAFGGGLSLYSSKEEALIGMYRTSLNVLSWLLPLGALIALLFLCSLPVRGLQGLWDTHHATLLMLTLLAAFIFLLNAAWQDCRERTGFPVLLLKLVSACILVMPVYVGLCAYSVGLRIQQHGWSIGRFWAVLAVLLSAIYAVGYAAVCFRRQTPWMKGARSVNVFAALVLCALLTLTATPLLDPARIVVDSQLTRLMSREIAPDDFDFSYLRFQAGRYGNDKLRELLAPSTHPQARRIHDLAQMHLGRQSPDEWHSHAQGLNRERLLSRLEVHPLEKAIDPGFIDFLAKQLDEKKFTPECLVNDPICQLWMVDLDDDGVGEFVFFDTFQSKVFGLANGAWKQVGVISGPNVRRLSRSHVEDVLRSGNASVLPRRWRDFQLGTDRFSVFDEQER